MKHRILSIVTTFLPICLITGCGGDSPQDELLTAQPGNSVERGHVAFCTNNIQGAPSCPVAIIAADEAKGREDAILNTLKSIKVHVSTNNIDDSVGLDMISQDWVSNINLQFPFSTFQTNAIACLSLARYLGDVRCVDFPTNLVYEAMPGIMMRSLNGNHVSAEQARRFKQEEERRKERRRQLSAEYGLQFRVFRGNALVEGYRRNLFSLCGKSVAGCRKIMSNEEFTVFTNELVTVSHATEDEQRGLFWELTQSSH